MRRKGRERRMKQIYEEKMESQGRQILQFVKMLL
jgi:hypothetical protein